MQWRDKEKLIRAGFTIIRERDYYPVPSSPGKKKQYHLSVCTGNSSWAKIGEFPTKTARRAAMDKLLLQDKYLED